MIKPDVINGSFELLGSLLIWLNIRKLHKDKMVKGVHWGPVAFWSAWGFWNLFYYPSLDQWLSFTGGVSVVLANTIWLCQMWYYLSLQPPPLPGVCEVCGSIKLSDEEKKAFVEALMNPPAPNERLKKLMQTPDYYTNNGAYNAVTDPEVHCSACGKTFLCDAMDACCRLCGARGTIKETHH